MNKYQKFFSEMTIEFAEELYKVSDVELRKIFKMQKINRDTLLRKVADVVLKYNVDDKACLNLSNSERKALYKEFRVLISEAFKNEYDAENKQLNELLITIGNDKYFSNSYLLSLGMDFNIEKMKKSELQKIINSSIDGIRYSDRIYDNKKAVAKKLQAEIEDLINGKTTINDISNVISHRFNVDASISKRLVSTEVSRTMEGSNEAWQHDHNIEYVMYMATLDLNTCDDCGEYDGKVCKIDEKVVETPVHPYCRCTWCALPSEDYKPDLRRDNNSKTTVNWQTYQEWKEKQDV